MIGTARRSSRTDRTRIAGRRTRLCETARQKNEHTPSLRKLWTVYKAILVKDGMSRRDQIIAQGAFYSGAWGILQTLEDILKDGDVEGLQRVIHRHGRTIQALQGNAPRKRRH